MFDIGWPELLVVAIVAIVFIGPKELPGMLRTFGQAIKKMRALAGDFQQQFDDALKDADLDGVKNTISDVRNLDPTKQIKDKLNPFKDDLDDVKKSVEEAADFDPETLFDESKMPDAPEPVKVDVDAALARQKALDDAAAKAAKKAAKPKSKPKAKTAAKLAVKKAAPKKVAVKKPAAKAKPAPKKAQKAKS